MKRPAIKWKLKQQCLLFRSIITCTICGLELFPGDQIHYDHIHELADAGPHEYKNLRPVHMECHRKKTIIACKQRAHIRRLAAGPKKSRRPMPKSQRKMQSRPFP